MHLLRYNGVHCRHIKFNVSHLKIFTYECISQKRNAVSNSFETGSCVYESSGCIAVATQSMPFPAITEVSGPLGMESRMVYDIVIIFLITELHSGYDLPWMPQNVVPFGIFAGSRRHTQHHITGRAYYQKFFVYADNFFGFVDNSEIVHSKTKKLP